MGLNINMHGMFPKKDSIWTKIKAARGIKKSRLKPLSRQTIIVKGYPGEIDELKWTISDKIEKYGLTIQPSFSSIPGSSPQKIKPTDIKINQPHATITAFNFDGWISSCKVGNDGTISTHINVLESVNQDLQLVLDGLSHEQTQQIQWIVNHNPHLHIVNPPKAAEDAPSLMDQPNYTIDMDDMLLTALSPILAKDDTYFPEAWSEKNGLDVGRFKIAMPPLIKELTNGSTICLRLPKGKTLPKELNALCHKHAVISYNGKPLYLTGQLVIKSIDTPPVEATPIPTSEPTFKSLEGHRDYYQGILNDALKTQSVVAIHGPPGCGKSSMFESEDHYSICADATMSSADIFGNPSVLAWIRDGGTLVIDEYTLLEPGVLTWLNTLTQDGVALHTNEGFQSISSHTHKVVLLGNPPESTLGRQSQHTVSMAVMTMASPPKQLWLQFATQSGMPADQLHQLDSIASDDWTSRDWQTAMELIRQSKGDHVRLWLDRELVIDIPQLQTNVADFLTYVDQIPANHYAIRALHVVGPAGVGKNHAIERACRGRPYKTMTLGLHTDIGEFKRFIDQCFEAGAICVIDEMTAAPTAVLEVLNKKLAEPCDNGFCVIATDNPYKEGREPMSDALMSRCFEWHASDITKKQADQILGLQRKAKQPTEFETVVDFHFYLKDTCRIPVSMRTLHLYKNHLKEQPISLRQKLDLMYGHFDPTLEKHVQAFNQSKHPTPHGYSLRKRDKAPAKEPPPRCKEIFGEGPKKEIPVPMTAPDQAKYVQISNQQVRTFVTRDGRLLGLDGRPVDPDTLHFEKPTNPTLADATQLKQPQSRPTQPHKRKRTAIDSQDEAATSNKQQAELSPSSHDMPPPPSFNDLGNRFVLFDTTASKVFDALDDENKILLTDLEHKTLGNKMGVSYKKDDKRPKKLQRILQGGGSIVIDLNSVRAKDLLTFNSIEAVINGDTSTIWGFGDPIKVSPHARFYFVGARSKSTQLPDFLSRCLSIRLDQLPKKTQQISLPGASVSQHPFGVPSALGKNRTLSATSSKDADQSLAAHVQKKQKTSTAPPVAFLHGLTSPTAIQFFEAFKRKLGECITNQLPDKAPVPHLTTPEEINMVFTALTLEQKKKVIDALVTWFKSVVTYDNGEYSQQNYNKSPYSNVVETCMHYRGLGVCRHHVATFEFCLQTIAQLDTYRCSVSPITSANGDSLTYQLFTNGSPTHCVLCLWLDNTVYVIDPTGSSHSPTNVSRGAGGPSSRRNGRQDRDFFKNLNPRCQEKLTKAFEDQPKLLHALFMTTSRGNLVIGPVSYSVLFEYEEKISHIDYIVKEVLGGGSLDINRLAKGEIVKTKNSMVKRVTERALVLSSKMKQLLLNLSSGDIPCISNIESNDKENDDEKLCAFYFPSKNKIVSIRPIFFNDESRGSCCDVFSVDAEWIPEAYIAAIYKISPHQAILLLKQNESSEALLSSIDPNWKIFLKNPLDLSKDELRIFLEKYPHYICHCNPLFKCDIEFIKEALKLNFRIFDFVHEEIRTNDEFVTECLTNHFDPKKLSSRRALVIETPLSKILLQQLSKRFNSVFGTKCRAVDYGHFELDRKCQELWTYPHIFQLSEELKLNKEFQMNYIQCLPQAVNHLPDQLKQDGEFILSVIKSQPMAYSYLNRDSCSNLPREFYETQHENPTCCVEDLIKTGPRELFGQSKPFCLKVFSDKEIALLNIYTYLSKEVLEFLFGSNLSSLSGYDEKARQLMIKYCVIIDD